MFKRINGVEPEIYTFDGFSESRFLNFVTGRNGGVSPAPYDSLNTDSNGGDNPANVRENLARINRAMGIEKLWTPRQVHQDTIAIVDGGGTPGEVEADAVIVATPGIAVGVRTADCLPIIIVNPSGAAACVIHAGRRSTELGITAKAIALLAARFNCDPSSLAAAIGPGIRRCCYEVDEDTAKRFDSCCGGADGRHLDIVGANMRQLVSAGVKPENVTDCGICASCENRSFFSYRKDGKVTGRFLTGVMIR
ncbi:MAG: laccase domain-containing protein [Nitrospinae bacterium]|nr:laccase domain-containing protein [Nitrospinota bacterium]MBF0635068.1 laccase domain-containing protein [Nitrospinota bacterium]